jgi:hypothetical protein
MPSNARKSTKSPLGVPVPKATPVADDLILHGDVSALTYAFINHPRRLVTCPIPDSIYTKIQGHSGGVSRFIEDAVASFDGNLEALVEAAVVFVDARRMNASTDPPRNASGRILPSTLKKIQKIQDALAGIRGMSRAKVLAGLIQLNMNL